MMAMLALLFAIRTDSVSGTPVTVNVTMNGRSVWEASVTAWPSNSSGHVELTTDETGAARFLLLPQKYHFYASVLIGSIQSSGSRDLAIVPGQPQQVEIVLDHHVNLDAPHIPEPLGPPPPEPYGSEPNYAVVRVQFATDRALSGSMNPADRFDAERDPAERLRLGVSEVSIPREHKIGELEESAVWRLEFKDNPEQHVVILSTTLQNSADFYDHLAPADTIVFVHGYRTTFGDAVRRAGQMKYDLAFAGNMIVYSWPSQGTLAGYLADEANVDWTAPHFVAFMNSLAAQTRSHSIHVLAHSMGNRVFAKAVEKLSVSGGRIFSSVILAAPDIDAAIFKRDILPVMTRLSNHITLYASSNDEALVASKKVHGYARAGDTAGGTVIAPGVDTIDVSFVDSSLIGHSYVGDNTTVLSDLFCILRGSLDPKDRPGLQRRGGYWRLVRAMFENVASLSSYRCNVSTIIPRSAP